MQLYEIFVYILLGFEALAAIVGILHWKQDKNTYWKYFTIYLILSFIGELVGFVLGKMKLIIWNQRLMEYLIIPAGFLLLYWIYSKRLKSKSLPIIISMLYLIIFLIDSFILHKNDVTSFFVMSYTSGYLMLLLLIFQFLFDLVKSEQIINFKKNRLFWISVGLLTFGLGSLPYYALHNYFQKVNKDFTDKYWYVSTILNYIQYLLFAFSFLCRKVYQK